MFEGKLIPLVMSVVEFKGEESIQEWEAEIEEVVIQMMCATDKRGLLIVENPQPLIDEFNALIKLVRDNMNNDAGDSCTFIPRGY